MKVVEKLLNWSEELVLDELSSIVNENSLRVFSKVRLSDVLEKSDTILTDRDFEFYTRSHFDFVVTESDFKPLLAVEYDGPSHELPTQKERDAIKDKLCAKAEFSLIRINANHVTRKFRGMTVLRWIVEVSWLQRGFYEAQLSGSIPFDEDFDPALMMPLDGKRKFPYWLSAAANIRIHDFLKLCPEPKGWFGFFGYDPKNNIHRLEYVRFADQIIFAKTAVRYQNTSIRLYDLANEIGICELDEKISKFKSGEMKAVALSEFRPIYDHFRKSYRAGSSHSMGTGLSVEN